MEDQKMDEKNSSIISTISSLVAISSAASMQYYIDEISKRKYALREFSVLTSTLLAASSYYFAMRFMSSKPSKSTQQKFIEALSRTTLDVKVNPEGQVATSVEMKPTPVKKEDTPKLQKKAENIIVERRDGNTYYKIQNLNIYLTAEVVQQLNMNPDKVINTLKGEVKAELEEFEKKNPNPENPEP